MRQAAGGSTARLTGSAVVIVLTGVIVMLSVTNTAAAGIGLPYVSLAFAALVCVGELVRVTLPGNRDAAPIATAGALGYALLPSFSDQVADYPAAQVVAVVAVAMAMGALPHVAAGRAPALDALCRRLLAIGAAAAAFRSTSLRETTGDLDPWQQAVVLIVVVLLALCLDAVLAAVVRAGQDGAPYGSVLRDEMRAVGGIGASIGSTGVLIALAAQFMGYWALPVFAVPLLLTQFAFRRYATVRATYLQTIRSLARVTEVGGYTETGHARRVSQLAVAVGRDLGMSEPDLLELEYAALMHDIGQLSLADPIPGGATVVASAEQQRQIAEYGAAVIRQTGVLDAVATVVELQAEPYRRPHEDPHGGIPLASRIIRAVNAYDDLVGDSIEMGRRLEALERLRLGMAYDYDPRVVDSLSRIVDRSARY